MSYQPSPIFAKTYDLLAWLIPITMQFPRSQRFVLAKRLQDSALDLHELLIAAGKSQGSERRRYLQRADIRLDQLRLHWRLCHTLVLVNDGRYQHGARLIDEVGRLLGGWRCIADSQKPIADKECVGNTLRPIPVYNALLETPVSGGRGTLWYRLSAIGLSAMKAGQ